MHHISRIYVGNYGHKECWYDGLVLSFTDKETHMPCDHIIHLENGGGKSTLLGGIFSCFETREDKFLKHLHDQKNKLADYFRKDGAPGFIVVEWQPTAVNGLNSKKVITGQAAGIKSLLSDQLERIFFHFECNDDLYLESLPVPKLSDKPVKDMGEFAAWLQKEKMKHRGNLYSTRSQSDWQRSLESERGIDVGLLKLQVEFSKQEGGMDAFLNFKDEPEFLRKFLGLTMDAERARSVRDSVALACDNLREKPVLEKRLLVLGKCHDVLREFVSTAQVFTKTKEILEASTTSLIRLASSLHLRVAYLASENLTMTEKLVIVKERLQTQELTKETLSNDLTGVEFNSLSLKCLKSKSEFDVACEQIETVNQEITLLKAAVLYKDLLSANGKVRELKNTYAQAIAELNPFKKDLNKCASILVFLLQRQMASCQAQYKYHEDTAQQAKTELKSIAEESNRLVENITKLETELALFDALESRRQTERQRFLEAGIFESTGELPQYVVEKLEMRLQDLHSNKLKLESGSADIASQIEELAQKELIVHRQLGAKESESEHVRKQHTEAVNKRALLAQDEVLCNLAECEFVDPESVSLIELLEKREHWLKEQLEQVAIKAATLAASQTEFDNSGLCGNSPDVAAVVRYLSEQGITSAISFSKYIADVVPEATQARALVASNPAKYLGVGLQNHAELETAAQLLTDGCKVSHPVMVSGTAHELVPGIPKEFVVLPEHDASFNFDAAQVFAVNLNESIRAEQRKQFELQNSSNQLVKSKTELSKYLKDFGEGGLVGLGQSILSLEAQIKAIKEELSDSEEKRILLNKKKEENRISIASMTAEIQKCSQAKRDVQLFLERTENEYLVKATTINDSRAEKERYSEKKLALELRRTQASESRESSLQSGQQAKSQEDLTRSELNKIHYGRHEDRTAFGSDNVDSDSCDYDENELLRQLETNQWTIDTARELYFNAKTVFEAKEQDRLGILQIEMEMARNDVEKCRSAFDKSYSHISKDELTPLLKRQPDEELNKHDLKLAVLNEQKQDLHVLFKSTESEFSKFKRTYVRAANHAKVSDALSEDELIVRKAKIESGLAECASKIERFNFEKTDLQHRIGEGNLAVTLLNRSLAYTLDSLDIEETIVAETSENFCTYLGIECEPIDKVVRIECAELKKIKVEHEKASRQALKIHGNLQSFGGNDDLTSVEPSLALHLQRNNLTDSIANADMLQLQLEQRIAAVLSKLSVLDKDFQETVEELSNLVNEAVHVLSLACRKKLPDTAPFVGGKAVIKLKKQLALSQSETRRALLSSYMQSIIESTFAHKTGTDLVADALSKVAGGDLGIQLVKLIRDPSEQYVSIKNISNSGGEAVSMAMFLYLLVAKIRSEMQVKIKHQVGGPLFLDNPFAKATSTFIWRAQRDLAQSLGVQLILATALQDYNALGEFDHFIRLKKIGQNDKTERWHIQQCEFSFLPSP